MVGDVAARPDAARAEGPAAARRVADRLGMRSAGSFLPSGVPPPTFMSAAVAVRSSRAMVPHTMLSDASRRPFLKSSSAASLPCAFCHPMSSAIAPVMTAAPPAATDATSPETLSRNDVHSMANADAEASTAG
jgi:hypothetical protein